MEMEEEKGSEREERDAALVHPWSEWNHTAPGGPPEENSS
jgi:hypothetical protein